jgi:hypothetical protein
MPSRKHLVAIVLVLFCLPAFAKKKILLPVDVLQARTAIVVIDPDAGIDPEDPYANRNAQDAVEKALMAWGRFSLVQESGRADLIIVVRRGNGKLARPTIGGIPNNDRPVVVQPTESGGRAGGHTGNAPTMDDPTESGPPDPTPSVEVGESQDMFVVYRGGGNGLNAPPVWRYIAKDALQSPGVPAVVEFQKLIAAAEKQVAANP